MEAGGLARVCYHIDCSSCASWLALKRNRNRISLVHVPFTFSTLTIIHIISLSLSLCLSLCLSIYAHTHWPLLQLHLSNNRYLINFPNCSNFVWCVQRCYSADHGWNHFLWPPSSRPTLTSDPWLQPGISLHTTSTHWIFSQFWDHCLSTLDGCVGCGENPRRSAAVCETLWPAAHLVPTATLITLRFHSNPLSSPFWCSFWALTSRLHFVYPPKCIRLLPWDLGPHCRLCGVQSHCSALVLAFYSYCWQVKTKHVSISAESCY